MGVGRVVCVAVPFVLSVASLVFLLIACLGGVTNKDLYMFRVDATDAQISRSQIQDVVENFKDVGSRDVPNIITQAVGGNENVTAKQLGIDNLYDVSLWGYCKTNNKGERDCTKAEFDWASEHLNTTWIDAVGELSRGRIELPDEVKDALDVFKKVTKWTQVAYIISFIALALTIIFGVFANCTRAMSCVTFLVAWVASIAVVASAALSTSMSLVVVASMEASAEVYGVRSNFQTTFLALVWASAACALGAGFFWLFTICCCAPNHKSRERKTRHRDSDGEKLMPGTNYQPLGSTQNHQGFYNPSNQYGAPRHPEGGRSDLAYEPYAHRG